MRSCKQLTCVASLLALAACSDDSGVTNNPDPGPLASVRFVNSVPDMGSVNLIFVDRVENLPTLQGVAFQSASGFFVGVQPGTRPVRVFPTSTNIDTAKTVLVDTTVNFAADVRHTLVYAGRAAGNVDQLAVITEARTPPAATAGNIAIKVLNAGTGLGNVDVYITPATSAANNANPIGNAVAVVRNVPYLGMSGYVNVPVRPFGGTGETLYQFTVTAAGSTTPLFSARPNQPGAAAPAGASYGPQPGVGIVGSVMTLVVTNSAVASPRQPARTGTATLLADLTCATSSNASAESRQC